MSKIKHIHDRIRQGESIANIVDGYLARAKESDLNAFREVFVESARQEAAAADKRLARGEPARALEGVPVAVKDNILVSGHQAGAGCKILEGFTAPFTATAIQKLQQAGAIIVGRTNMDEFAMGSSTEHSAYGATKHPLDSTRSPGGSSGGSAAAVAADLAAVALGSETGGSVRQPASFCGLVGLKPSYGAVSRYGLIALASSLDQIGPLGETVEDVQAIYQIIKGEDPMDVTSRNFSPLSSPKHLKDWKIGIPTLWFAEGLEPEVKNNFEQTIKRLAKAGCQIKEIALPTAKLALAIYYIIMPAEASSNLSRFDGLRFGRYQAGSSDLLSDYLTTRAGGFGSEARRRIIIGTYVLSAGHVDAYYGRAVSLRARLTQEFEQAFGEVDLILTPTTPTPAFKLGERVANPLEMYLADIFTTPANLTGLPAISLPSGTTISGLPLGLQAIARAGGEERLFAFGTHYESLG